MRDFIVWCPDLGSGFEDGKMFRAIDAADAATMWAQREDCESADYWIVGGTEANVVVRDAIKGEDLRFVVTGETVARYSARAAA